MRYINQALVKWWRVWPASAGYFQSYEGEHAMFAQEPVPGPVVDFDTPGQAACFGIVGPELDARWLGQKEVSGSWYESNTQLRFFVRKSLFGADTVEDLCEEARKGLHKNVANLNIVKDGAAPFTFKLSDVSGVYSVDTDNLWGRLTNLRVVVEFD